MSAGEGAFVIAEKLRLDQLGGDCRAVDGDQRLAGAAAGAVQGLDEDFLAHPGFTLDQYRDVLFQ
ncbi:hypothetical protein D3C79_1110620 [compost metagenome]